MFALPRFRQNYSAILPDVYMTRQFYTGSYLHIT